MDFGDSVDERDAWYEFVEFISGTQPGTEKTITFKCGEVYRIRREK